MAEERDQHCFAAILATDIVGCLRLMGKDQAGTLRELREVWAEQFNFLATTQPGCIVKIKGNGALVEFASIVSG